MTHFQGCMSVKKFLMKVLIFIRLECEMTECLSVIFSGEHLPNKNSADSMPSFNKTICTFW